MDDVTAQMMADLGLERREKLARIDDRNPSGAPPDPCEVARNLAREKQRRDEVAQQGDGALNAWNVPTNFDRDPRLSAMQGSSDGQMHRENLRRNLAGSAPQFSHDRGPSSRPRVSAGHANFPQTNPGSFGTSSRIAPRSTGPSHVRAPSPRQFGTKRIVNGQIVSDTTGSRVNEAAAASSSSPINRSTAPTTSSALRAENRRPSRFTGTNQVNPKAGAASITVGGRRAFNESSRMDNRSEKQPRLSVNNVPPSPYTSRPSANPPSRSASVVSIKSLQNGSDRSFPPSRTSDSTSRRPPSSRPTSVNGASAPPQQSVMDPGRMDQTLLAQALHCIISRTNDHHLLHQDPRAAMHLHVARDLLAAEVMAIVSAAPKPSAAESHPYWQTHPEREWLLPFALKAWRGACDKGVFTEKYYRTSSELERALYAHAKAIAAGRVGEGKMPATAAVPVGDATEGGEQEQATGATSETAPAVTNGLSLGGKNAVRHDSVVDVDDESHKTQPELHRSSGMPVEPCGSSGNSPIKSTAAITDPFTTDEALTHLTVNGSAASRIIGKIQVGCARTIGSALVWLVAFSGQAPVECSHSSGTGLDVAKFMRLLQSMTEDMEALAQRSNNKDDDDDPTVPGGKVAKQQQQHDLPITDNGQEREWIHVNGIDAVDEGNALHTDVMVNGHKAAHATLPQQSKETVLPGSWSKSEDYLAPCQLPHPLVANGFIGEDGHEDEDEHQGVLTPTAEDAATWLDAGIF